MADRKNRKLPPKILQEDIIALDALEALTDYAPSNPAYSKARAQEIRTATQADEAKFTRDEAQASASRDKMVASQWERHDFVQGSSVQVKAQYGENSDEYASFGFKKKSEYKTPKRKPKTS